MMMLLDLTGFYWILLDSIHDFHLNDIQVKPLHFDPCCYEAVAALKREIQGPSSKIRHNGNLLITLLDPELVDNESIDLDTVTELL